MKATTRKKNPSPRMWAARLHGARDLRLEQIDRPQSARAGHVLLRITVTGVCGSDLHSYTDGQLGGTRPKSPLIPGHEFAGVIEAVGGDARDGMGQPLRIGQRVAVDPAMPCHHCEFCEQGHPNLCQRLRFCGLWPDNGSLCETMEMPARCCFPLPDDVTDIEGALAEPLGVAIHAERLAQVQIGDTVAVLGCGPIGLLISQLAKLAGARQVLATDLLPWRLKLARHYGVDHALAAQSDPVDAMKAITQGRGVDVVFEAAWADQTVGQSAELARPGGRVILVGIPSDDRLTMSASTARRKGLTIKLCRRMKQTYPLALRLIQQRQVELNRLVTHRFPLAKAAQAFDLNADYRDGIVKAIIEQR